jgi:hypothetical protein
MSRKITVAKQDLGKLVHVEAPGCVINIRVGLADEKGREVTSVEVLADGERFAGESWRIVGSKSTARVVRVRKEK